MKRVRITDAGRNVINQVYAKHNKDAAVSMVVENELEAMDKRIMNELQAELYYTEDIPLNTTQVAPGHTSYSWNFISKFGKAKRISSGATDIPTVELGKEKFTYAVEPYALGYDLTTQELDSMALIGMPIRSEKGTAVVQGFAQTFNSVAYLGDAEADKTGLLNNPYVTNTQVANNAGATSRLWSAKTQAERLADVAAIWQLQITAAKGNMLLRPTDVIIPALYEGYCKQPYGTASDKTLEMMIKDNYGLNVKYRSEVEGIYAGSTNGLFMYAKNPLFVEFLVAKDVTALADQAKGLSIVVPYEARIVGTVIRYPIAFHVGYGI